MPIPKTRLALAAGSIVLLTACSTAPSPTPAAPTTTAAAITDATIDGDGDAGTANAGSAMLDCDSAYPTRLGGTDPSVVTVLPDDWPQPPAEAELCSAVMLTDTSGVLQYVTGLGQDEVIDHYESGLQAYDSVERGPGIAGQPILNLETDLLAAAVQTEPGKYLVSVALH